MKTTLVVNTNRIIAALIRDSVSRKLFYHSDLELLGIRFSNTEVGNHRSLIIEKAGIPGNDFDILMEKLCSRIILLDDELILNHMEEAAQVMRGIDVDDAPFIAAAIATGVGIWSDDSHLSRQNRIRIWKTVDLAREFGY